MLDTEDRSPRAPRIVLYSHDTLGFGHLRRNLLIAGALRDSAMAPQILMITGMREAGAFELPKGVDCLSMPAYEKGRDGSYRPRDLGGDLATLVQIRSQAIKAAVEAFRPDLMIVDNVPRGALQELDPLLEALHAEGHTRLVLGLRDVIDTAETVRRQWEDKRNFETVARYYDDVWIYGDPAFYDLIKDCGMARSLGGKGRFTGYLDHSARLASPIAVRSRDAILGDDPRPYVLCAVGGGRDGHALCEAFVETTLPEGHRGILVTGSQMSGVVRSNLRSRAEARGDMMLLDFVQEPIALMQGAARIVAMGGYNTICEVLSLRRPALIAPRTTPRAEQVIRAEMLEAHGLISVIRPERISAGTLGAWLAGPVPHPGNVQIDMWGLERVCKLAEAMLADAPELHSAN
ncbi:glycosyl transferase family 28 (plasmid) [Pseudorhodobacter turbinis]|uniref:Glycosyl transferase family 28 n=1 Tax=Pseudorhodobacter turbinis TaxID=2500533 RepID=A0A4P8EJ01_9RHOB|nr:glycosyl transferase family 28 [Pseudorhodobacter turbinis]QCO56675.1 glycosyl transferase family 28 [Pseudorhodobacter turbinis]